MKQYRFNKVIYLLLIIMFINIFCSFNSVKAESTYVVSQKNASFTSSSGYTVKATLMVPSGISDKVPLVVMCHGYTGKKEGDGQRFIKLGNLLAKNGIAAITIDFPGCGESPASSENYTLSNMYKDINSAISYMDSNYSIDTSKIGLTGHSMGGRVASLYTQSGGYSVSALALWAPANGDGTNGKEFLSKGSFNFNYSQAFINEMDNSHPNSALSAFSGRTLLFVDSMDKNGEGPLSSETISQTIETVGEGNTIEYNDNHNFDSNGGKVVKETANLFTNVFLGRDVIEGEAEEDSKRYTIEDIIFNRIPILDINFFSDTAAGEKISEDSVVFVIRQTVAAWYVSFRNLAIVSLAIIIIYVGIRMALSTIPQGKAKYKQMLIGWIQALVIVFIVHYIMIIIINTNNSIVELIGKAHEQKMAQSGWSEVSIYDTIESRSYDNRVSVWAGALIMYLALAIMFFRFLWVYIKRSFTILILVIIAPFIGAKYAIDSATGKKGNSFRSWLFDFIYNVLLQTVHALIYTSLMTVVISIAFESLTGYLIALIFMNFILSADEIFRNIFNFDKSAIASDTAKQESYKEAMSKFTGAVFIGQMVKGSIGTVKFAGNVGATALNRGYRAVTRKHPGIKDFVDTKLDAIDSKIEKATEAPQVKGDATNLNESKSSLLNAIHYQAKIRRLSRKDGAIGVKARSIKSSITAHRKKRYTSNFKLVKDIVTGSASVVFAIPMSIVNLSAGTGMLTSGINSLKKVSGKKHYKYDKRKGKIVKQSDLGYKAEKYTKKRDKYYASIDLAEKISMEEEDIRNNVAELKKKGLISDNDLDDYKKKTNVFLVEASATAIDRIMEDYIEREEITNLDNLSINAIIDEVADQLQINTKMDNATKQILTSKAKSKIIMLNAKRTKEDSQNYDFGNDKDSEIKIKPKDISKVISKSVIESIDDNRFGSLTRDLFQLDKDIKEFESKAKTRYRGANKFLENL